MTNGIILPIVLFCSDSRTWINRRWLSVLPNGTCRCVRLWCMSTHCQAPASAASVTAAATAAAVVWSFVNDQFLLHYCACYTTAKRLFNKPYWCWWVGVNVQTSAERYRTPFPTLQFPVCPLRCCRPVTERRQYSTDWFARRSMESHHV